MSTLSQTPAYDLGAYVSIKDDDVTVEEEKNITMEVTRKETNKPEEEEKADHGQDV
jgi:hypothetical protein